METSHPVSKTTFKPRANVKNYILRYSDKSISVISLFLVNDDCDVADNETVLCHKYNKKLVGRYSGRMSYETVMAMSYVLNQDVDDILFFTQVLTLKQ